MTNRIISRFCSNLFSSRARLRKRSNAKIEMGKLKSHPGLKIWRGYINLSSFREEFRDVRRSSFLATAISCSPHGELRSPFVVRSRAKLRLLRRARIFLIVMCCRTCTHAFIFYREEGEEGRGEAFSRPPVRKYPRVNDHTRHTKSGSGRARGSKRV